MADGTKIEWTEATWNPITGCSVTSPGCTNCYAMKLAGTRLQHHPSRAGLTVNTKAGPVWTGETRFNEEWLDQPLRWKRPRMIFVCAHGDLFHESVSDEWIDRVFAVMALAPQHTFQVLTKRAKRMRTYFSGDWVKRVLADLYRECGEHHQYFQAEYDLGDFGYLRNIWLGVSVEDQARRERIIDLSQTPAAVRWISGEPLIEGLRLTNIPLNGGPDEHGDQWLFNALTGEQYFVGDDGYHYSGDGPAMQPLDWIVVGGESGPGARPMHPEWARSLRDQCAAAGVPLFFKQWGEWSPIESWQPWDRTPQRAVRVDGTAMPDEDWFDDGQRFKAVGKKRAGRLLDGVEHNGMPEALDAR